MDGDGDDLETTCGMGWGWGLELRGRSGMGINICPRAAVYVKFCFRAGLAGSDCATFEKQLRETNKDR